MRTATQTRFAFEYGCRRFESVDTDGRRIDKVLASRLPTSAGDVFGDQIG